MMMLIRSMAPDVVAVDEIGGDPDLEAAALRDELRLPVLATVHGTSMEDIRNKPGFCRFLEEDIFERYVILGNKAGTGNRS